MSKRIAGSALCILTIFLNSGIASEVPATEAEIKELYQTVLGREPDLEGANWWKNTGVSAEEVKKGFLESEEYKTKVAPAVNTKNEAATISGNVIPAPTPLTEAVSTAASKTNALATAPAIPLGYVDCGDVRYDTNTATTSNGKKITADNFSPGMVCFTKSSIGTLLAGPPLRDPIYNDLLAKEKANDLAFRKVRDSVGDLSNPENFEKFSAARDLYLQNHLSMAQERSELQSKRNFYFINGYNIGSTATSSEKFNPAAVAPQSAPIGWIGYYNPAHPDWTVDPKEYFKNSPGILRKLDQPGNQAGGAIQGQNNLSSLFYEKIVSQHKYQKEAREQNTACFNSLPDPSTNYEAHNVAYQNCIKASHALADEWRALDSKLTEKSNNYWKHSNPLEKEYSNEATMNVQPNVSSTYLNIKNTIVSKNVQSRDYNPSNSTAAISPSKTNIKTCTFDIGSDLEQSQGVSSEVVNEKVRGDIILANANLTNECKKFDNATDAAGVNASAILTDYTKALADISGRIATENSIIANQLTIPISGKLSLLPFSVNAAAIKAAVRFSNNSIASSELYKKSLEYAKYHLNTVKSSNASNAKSEAALIAANKKVQVVNALVSKNSFYKPRAIFLSEMKNQLASFNANSNNQSEVNNLTNENLTNIGKVKVANAAAVSNNSKSVTTINANSKKALPKNNAQLATIKETEGAIQEPAPLLKDQGQTIEQKKITSEQHRK